MNINITIPVWFVNAASYTCAYLLLAIVILAGLLVVSSYAYRVCRQGPAWEKICRAARQLKQKRSIIEPMEQEIEQLKKELKRTQDAWHESNTQIINERAKSDPNLAGYGIINPDGTEDSK